jgi:hypothetical protein
MRFIKINVTKKPSVMSHELFEDSPRLFENDELNTPEVRAQVLKSIYNFGIDHGIDTYNAIVCIDRIANDDPNSFYLLPVHEQTVDALTEAVLASPVVESFFFVNLETALELYKKWENKEVIEPLEGYNASEPIVQL